MGERYSTSGRKKNEREEVWKGPEETDTHPPEHLFVHRPGPGRNEQVGFEAWDGVSKCGAGGEQ